MPERQENIDRGPVISDHPKKEPEIEVGGVYWPQLEPVLRQQFQEQVKKASTEQTQSLNVQIEKIRALPIEEAVPQLNEFLFGLGLLIYLAKSRQGDVSMQAQAAVAQAFDLAADKVTKGRVGIDNLLVTATDHDKREYYQLDPYRKTEAAARLLEGLATPETVSFIENQVKERAGLILAGIAYQLVSKKKIT